MDIITLILALVMLVTGILVAVTAPPNKWLGVYLSAFALLILLGKGYTMMHGTVVN